MIVHIARISTSVGHLGNGPRVVLIRETLLNEESLLLLLELLRVLADRGHYLLRKRHTRVPPDVLRAEQVTINLVLDNISNFLCLRKHVRVLVKECVLIRVACLTVSNGADGLGLAADNTGS